MRTTLITLIVFIISGSAIAQEHDNYPCAQAGYLICQLELGKAYAFGDGVAVDFDQALYWLKKKPESEGNIQALDLIEAIEKFRKNGDVSLLENIKADHIEASKPLSKTKNSDLSNGEVNSQIEKFRQTEEFTPEFVDLMANHPAELQEWKERQQPDKNTSTDEYDDLSGNELIVQSVMDKEYGFLSAYLIFSFILTWVIGLSPPVLIRYVIVKRPLKKWPAIAICALFAVVNVSIFTYLGSKSHGALTLVALISYFLLTKGNGVKNNLSTPTVHKKVNK